MNIDSEVKDFLACMSCARVVMRTMPTETQMSVNKRKKNTSTTKSSPQLKVTLCYSCDEANNIRNTKVWNDHRMTLHIDKRMIESWYIYAALTKLMDKNIDLKASENDMIRLINRDEFSHLTAGAGGLMTVQIQLDDPKEATAIICSHLVTGFF